MNFLFLKYFSQILLCNCNLSKKARLIPRNWEAWNLHPGAHMIWPINSGSKIYKQNRYYIYSTPAYLMNFHSVILGKLNIFSNWMLSGYIQKSEHSLKVSMNAPDFWYKGMICGLVLQRGEHEFNIIKWFETLVNSFYFKYWKSDFHWAGRVHILFFVWSIE